MPLNVPLAHALPRDTPSLAAGARVSDAARALGRAPQRPVLVVDHGVLVGAVSAREVLLAAAATPLEDASITSVMGPAPATAPANLPIRDALERMRTANVDALAVVNEGGAVLGVVTSHDLLRHLGLLSGANDPDALDALGAQIAILDPEGRIRVTNAAWDEFGMANTPGGDRPRSGAGINYLSLCRACRGVDAEGAIEAADGIERVLRGETPSFVQEYPCHAPTAQRWFQMHATPLPNGRGALVAHYDITARKLSEIQVAYQTQKLELALSASQLGVWSIDLATRVVTYSDEVYRILGTSQVAGGPSSWDDVMHPEDRDAVRAAFERSLVEGLPFSATFRLIRPDGALRWVTSLARVQPDERGTPRTVVGTLADVTDRVRAQAALNAYNAILELIATGADLLPILEAIVRLVEDQVPGALCSVLLVEADTGRLRFGAGPSLPAAYNRGVDGVPIGPSSGSCGTAAFRGDTVVVTDIANDPLWAEYRDLALAHGLRSCLSVPIFGSGEGFGRPHPMVIGTFALYFREARAPDPATYAVLLGAEPLARGAIQGPRGTEPTTPAEPIIEAAHLAGVAIERKQSEQALRDGEARFRSVLDSAPVGVFLKDPEQRYLFVNHAMAAWFGVVQPDWEGRRAHDVLPNEAAAASDNLDRRALEIGGPVQVEVEITLPAGRTLLAVATHVPLEREGRPAGTFGILHDVTDLASARQELGRLWRHAPEPLYVADLDGRFRRVNPAWQRVLGLSEAELLGSSWLARVHADDLPAASEVLGRLQRGETIHRFECRYQAANGKFRWLSWEVIPLTADRVVYGFVRDVTEEKELGEQFRQAQKMEAIGRLASGVAHDFNNLLTVIDGYSAMLLAHLPPDDPDREPLEEIGEASRRASDLTAQLLAFSRKAVIEPKVVDVRGLLEASTRLIRRLIGEDIQLVTHLAPVPLVRVDPGQLQQIFMNLAVNARDAMPTGGRLTVATDEVNRDGERWVRVTVSDTGCGMTEEVKSHIFEPFYTTKGVGKGTGLGLATVYGIAKQAGGTVLVASEPGAGASFMVHLPATHEASPSAVPAGPSRAARGAETILLVEDERAVRRLARRALETQGYTVIVAANGTEALAIEIEHAGAIDLLITDVVMPGLGGRDLADRLRARRPGLRVLFVSGYTDDAVLVHGVESSRDQFLQKPFNPATLGIRVREALDGSREPKATVPAP